MPDLDRVIAGLRCRDLLPQLPDYVDGELSAEVVGRFHLVGLADLPPVLPPQRIAGDREQPSPRRARAAIRRGTPPGRHKAFLKRILCVIGSGLE